MENIDVTLSNLTDVNLSMDTLLFFSFLFFSFGC